MKPRELVASAIARERERAGLSLSALAAKAEIAKSTLSQLEAGKGNPSIETLWAIASALQVPFSFLFESTASSRRLIRAGDGDLLSADSAEFCALLLDKCPPTNRRDLYRTSFARGSIRQAKAHPQGTIEHAFVCHGVVRLGPVDDCEELHPGDYFSYPGDVDHLYEAISETVTLMLVMDSPR
ncbi:MAG: helix-turn-helix domain-containing protein [Pseudomonadales bacterium]